MGKTKETLKYLPVMVAFGSLFLTSSLYAKSVPQCAKTLEVNGDQAFAKIVQSLKAKKAKMERQMMPAVYGFLVSGSSKITGFSTVKTTSSGLDMGRI